MPRKTIPCAFSCTAEFLGKIDVRARSLGMNRSQYILQVLRKDLLSGNPNMNIIAEQPGTYADRGTGSRRGRPPQHRV